MYSYENRFGKRYFIRQTRTKTGKPKWTISTDSCDALATIPPGQEIYENINGQVVIRRIKPCLISEEEMQIVQQILKEKSKHKCVHTRKDGNEICFFEPLGNTDAVTETMVKYGSIKDVDPVEYLLKHARFVAFFKVILTDETLRHFQAQRFCYLGSIDDWINIGEPQPLDKLLRKYIPHFGQDSFFELAY